MYSIDIHAIHTTGETRACTLILFLEISGGDYLRLNIGIFQM